MGRGMLAVACVLLLALSAPVRAQDSDGDGVADADEDMNGNGIPDSQEPGGQQPNRMEAECLSTARPEICLAYFDLYCSSFGFPLACAMAQIGHGCQSGDGNACGYFQQVLQANTACAGGNQEACGWLAQQPLPRS